MRLSMGVEPLWTRLAAVTVFLVLLTPASSWAAPSTNQRLWLRIAIAACRKAIDFRPTLCDEPSLASVSVVISTTNKGYGVMFLHHPRGILDDYVFMPVLMADVFSGDAQSGSKNASSPVVIPSPTTARGPSLPPYGELGEIRFEGEDLYIAMLACDKLAREDLLRCDHPEIDPYRVSLEQGMTSWGVDFSIDENGKRNYHVLVDKSEVSPTPTVR
jgi:hypothetical protein